MEVEEKKQRKDLLWFICIHVFVGHIKIEDLIEMVYKGFQMFAHSSLSATGSFNKMNTNRFVDGLMIS